MSRLLVRRPFRSGMAVGLLAAALLFHALPSRGADVPPEEKSAFRAAILDAQADGTQAKVRRDLLALVPGMDKVNRRRLHGGSIRWEGEPGASRVLVAVFMSRDTYDRYYRDNLEQHLPTYTLTKSLWVTVVPELRTYFAGKACPPTRKRVVKALGLNPAYSYDVILEMWVDPAALFRPAPDPETADHEAETSAEDGAGTWAFPNDSNPFLRFDDAAAFVDHQGGTRYTFRQWFAWNATRSYAMPDPEDVSTWGVPWTRLGYTYDWGRPGDDHEGLSEFILRIDPDSDGGQLVVTLVEAVDRSTTAWQNYFRCDCPDAEEAPAEEEPEDPGHGVTSNK